MIILKSGDEIKKIRDSGNIIAQAFEEIEKNIKPGMSTYDVDQIVDSLIARNGAKASFKGYNGFPNATCISINEVLIHGIPSKKHIIKEGDIVSVDIGVYLNGYHADAARTYCIGKVKPETDKLVKVTEQSFFASLEFATPENRLFDISSAIEEVVKKNGFYVVREYVGHGIGKDLHEDPAIPNYGKKGTGPRLKEGMVLAIEPMVLINSSRVFTKSDGWAVVSTNGLPTAHYENTIAIVNGKPEILTL